MSFRPAQVLVCCHKFLCHIGTFFYIHGTYPLISPLTSPYLDDVLIKPVHMTLIACPIQMIEASPARRMYFKKSGRMKLESDIQIPTPASLEEVLRA